MADYAVYPAKEPSKQARALAEQVERDGGHVMAVYQEPIGEHWQLFVLLPRTKVAASPYQRDVSPTHVKRLTEAVKKIDRFVDPILAVSPEPGVYWTPNGNHRRTALDKLKAEHVPAILAAEQEVALQALPPTTENARTTPLTRARKTLPSFEQTFKKLREALEDFDVAKVRYDEIQRSAIMMAPAAAD